MRFLVVLTFVGFWSSDGAAGDVYLLQGSATGLAINEPGRPTECELAVWLTDTIFYNRGTAPATVRFVGVSNGVPRDADLSQFTVPPGRTASLSVMTGSAWTPLSATPLWVLHLNVDDTVQIENALFVGTEHFGACPVGIPPQTSFNRGRVSVPIHTALVGAGLPQHHLATYLGRDILSRINVAIYNSSDREAEAVLELRQHCNDAVMESRTVTVAPNAILQYNRAFTRTQPEACPPSQDASRQLGGPSGALYTVIAVSEPSLTFVSNVSEGKPPMAGVGVW